MDLGGGTKYRNDVLLDGTPLIAGNKLGYTPPMDAVTEYTVQQNSVDAEFGHSAGGIVLMTMKSGTNQFHGSAYYYGRNAGLNAITDRAIRRHTETPYWTAGGTLGMPIIKNKLFVFGVFEKIENGQAEPGHLHAADRARAHRATSRNRSPTARALRVIYDPATTARSPPTSRPFAGNIIPANRQDPVSQKAAGESVESHIGRRRRRPLLNNFKYLNELNFHYYNYSARVDYNISDKWKVFGRVSRFKTDQDQDDFTNGQDPLKMRNVTGSKRNGWNIAGDSVYMINPRPMTLDVRGSFYKVEDKRDYPAMASRKPTKHDLAQRVVEVRDDGLHGGKAADLFPAHPGGRAPPTATSACRISGISSPTGTAFTRALSKYFNKHYLKAGAEARFKRGSGGAVLFRRLPLHLAGDRQGTTAGRTPSPGTPGRAFVLGAINPAGANVRYNVLQNANTEMYGFYFQDDYKVTPKADPESGLALRVRGRALGSAEPHSAATGSDRPDSRACRPPSTR